MKRGPHGPHLRSGESEAEILKQISTYLDILQNQGRVVWVRHNSTRFALVKGRLRGVKMRASQIGAPDIILWGPQGTYCVEIKTAKGILSDEQLDWQRRAELMGLQYRVVRSFDGFRKATGL